MLALFTYTFLYYANEETDVLLFFLFTSSPAQQENTALNQAQCSLNFRHNLSNVHQKKETESMTPTVL